MKPSQLEAVSFSFKKKPGYCIVTFIDGSVKEWKVDDPEFLDMEFKLVPTKGSADG